MQFGFPHLGKCDAESAVTQRLDARTHTKARLNVFAMAMRCHPSLCENLQHPRAYNTVRPHTALANLTPAAYKAKALEKLRLELNG